MKPLIILMFGVLIVTKCEGSSVLVIGSKYIRPKQPFMVAFANPNNTNVKLKLHLSCDDRFQKNETLTLTRTSTKVHKFNVPDMPYNDSNCRFHVKNDGGKMMVDHEIELTFATKTLSIFILPDKPIYKPGEILRFRVVLIDFMMKPVQHIAGININLKDSNGDSRRQWKNAKLLKGVFEADYLLPQIPALGDWTISVTAANYNVSNEKEQRFEVREYVLPKFVVEVVPSRTLLSDEKKVLLTVTSHYTFGRPVQGNVSVELFADPDIPKPTNKILNEPFDRRATFSFDLQKPLINTGDDFKMVNVKVNVNLTETFSNSMVFVTNDIPVYKHPYNVVLIQPSMEYHPGAKYFCKVAVKDHYGIPVDALGKDITLIRETGETDTSQLDKHGMASFELMMPDEDIEIAISAEFEGRDYGQIGTVQGSAETTQYLQVTSKERTIAGRTATFSVSSNFPFDHLIYFVVTRGSISLANYQKVAMKKSFPLKVQVSASMGPQAKLLVYTIKNSQLIMGSFEMDFESFDNDFEYYLDETQYQPNQDIYITGKAAEDSFVAFQAIDEGAFMLKHDPFGFTIEKLLEDLDDYIGGRSEIENNLDFIDSLGLFTRSGLKHQITGSSRMKRDVRKKIAVQPIFLRTQFPEAWLWMNSTMKSSKSYSIEGVVPDTITSWFVTGFALSPSKGLGLTKAPQKITVDKKFYMVANLPYSIKRDEVVLVKVTLFNFLGSDLTTDVTLFNKRDQIEFVDRATNDVSKRSKAIVVPTHQAIPISFLIKAKTLGEIAIKIEAKNDLTSDGLEHMLRVTPESHRHVNTEAEFINLPSYGSQRFNITCNIPRKSDEGSTAINLIIDPPTMAIVAQKLESFFNLPTDSGDLNLLKFIPSVVVLEYLKETTKIANDVKERAINVLSSSYQNQLKYKHTDGSFGQWKPPQGKPSVFLTALVANAFSIASKHIKVDYDVITNAITWISSKQKSNGCFEEDGEIIYPPMQNSSSSIPLTAFIVAIIAENNNLTTRFGVMKDNGVECLSNHFDMLTNDYYISLATYALSLAKHPERQRYRNRLIRDSTSIDEARSWNGVMNVEIAGYALLTYLSMDDFLGAIPIMKWLSKQTYETGHFNGVHSTFVGLKALGKMATYFTRIENDYTVQLFYDNSTNVRGTFGVTDKDPLKYIDVTLPHEKRKFYFKIEGRGFGKLQVTYQYHINIQNDKQHFDLAVKVLSSSNYHLQNLSVCLKYKPNEAFIVSGTTMVQVHLPSGLVASTNAVRDLSNNITNTQLNFGNTVVYVYYSALTTNEVCFEVTAHRKYDIALHHPSYVVVYDTNNMNQFAIQTYEGKVAQLCDICDADDCKSMKC